MPLPIREALDVQQSWATFKDWLLRLYDHTAAILPGAEASAGIAASKASEAAASASTTQTLRDSFVAVYGSIGYKVPVAYTSGISMTLATQTVSYLGTVYAPNLADLPFSTSGTFETAKFRVIQGGDSASVVYRNTNAKARLDAAGFTYKSKPLRRALRQIALMSNQNNTPARLRLFNGGDSLGVCAQYLTHQLVSAFGLAGYFSPVGNQTVIASPLNGGGATLNSGFVYTDTPTGESVSIGGAGQFAGNTVITNGNSNPYVATAENSVVNARQTNANFPFCNLVKAIYIGGVGGATFKVQYSTDANNNWTDVPTLTAVDASLTTGNQTITGVIPECMVTGVRCLWVSGGAVKIYAVGAESTTRGGIVACSFNRGSIPLGLDGFAAGSGAANLLSTCAPDLFTACALDGVVATPTTGFGIVPAMTAVNALLTALPAVPDQLWYGIPNTSGDPEANTAAYNDAMKLYAESIGAAFVDTYRIMGSYTTANGLGLQADATHPNGYGWLLVHQEFMALHGFDDFAFGQQTRPKQDSSRNLWRGNFGAWPDALSYTLTTGAATTEVTPGFQIFRQGTWVGSIQVDRLTLDQKEDPSFDRYGIRIQSTTTSGTFPSVLVPVSPGRMGAGKQVTMRLKVKGAAAGVLGVFFGRFAGTGTSYSAGNQNLSYGTAWREYKVTTTLPPFLNDEVNGSNCGFSFSNFVNGSDVSFKDIDVVFGPVVDRVHTSPFVETFAFDFASIAAATMASTTFAVIGIKKGEAVRVQRPAGLTAAVMLDAAVTADNVVTLYALNPTAAAIDPPALNYVFTFGV